jgi:hypothetical protein
MWRIRIRLWTYLVIVFLSRRDKVVAHKVRLYIAEFTEYKIFYTTDDCMKEEEKKVQRKAYA